MKLLQSDVDEGWNNFISHVTMPLLRINVHVITVPAINQKFPVNLTLHKCAGLCAYVSSASESSDFMLLYKLVFNFNFI